VVGLFVRQGEVDAVFEIWLTGFEDGMFRELACDVARCRVCTCERARLSCASTNVVH
jgi:dihydropteroate synthase